MQEQFAFYRIKQMLEANPGLAKKQPFKAAAEHDKAYFEKGGMKAVLELIMASHTNLSEQEFEKSVTDFFAQAKATKIEGSAKQTTYQPQIELLKYLRANGFKTYICTGGTIEFVRGVSEDFYGIPKEQVVGTSFQYQFIDSNRTVLRKPALNSFNDKEAKPGNIQLHIGKTPVFACGNEGGAADLAMLKYSQTSKYPSFQLIVNHNDSVREFYYQEKDNESLRTAAENNWHVVDMQKDWKTIFVK